VKISAKQIAQERLGLMKATNRKNDGFTLTELLVVLGCLALLAATLLPALAATKLKELSTQCLGNLRQLAMAASIYQTENDSIPWSGVNQLWFTPLNSVQNSGALHLLCPLAMKTPIPNVGNSQGKADTSWAWSVTNGGYGLNGWLYGFNNVFSGFGLSNFNFFGSTAAVAHPRQTPEFMDAYWPDLWPYENGPDFAGNWYPYDAHGLAGNNTPPYNGMLRCFMMRHGNSPPLAGPPGYAISRFVKPMPGGINVSFVDGHASYTRLDDLWLLYWNRNAVPVPRR
jgi:prepilin-type N-terminal cleavage/methylation domain-containing protein/prepilin-type processing-associated H-X9-DG protein